MHVVIVPLRSMRRAVRASSIHARAFFARCKSRDVRHYGRLAVMANIPCQDIAIGLLAIED